MFKLGLDFHGVVDAMPSLADLANIILKSGGEVHILTGGKKPEVMKDLRNLNFPYSNVFSIQDHLDKHHHDLNIGINPKDGNTMYPDELWDCIKAWYCTKNSISLHMDDTMKYGEYFTTPFARLWTKNDRPKKTDKPKRHLA